MMKAVLRKEQTAATALRARLLEVDDAHLLSPVASGTLAQSVIANPRLDVDRTWLADRNEQFDGARSLNSGRIPIYWPGYPGGGGSALATEVDCDVRSPSAFMG
jgi:hypothetical protein